MLLWSETIYALSTAPGRAGVAVVRVSGPDSAALIETLSGKPCPSPRIASLRDLAHDGVAIDRALVLYFAAPASFTGEDMAEFQVHGGLAVIRSLSRALEALDARRAEPGEFSRRAFHNGKIDLTGAEALADLIDAESEAQQAQALAQAGGVLERLYAGWSQRLLRALAHVEASLDFADEELPGDLLDKVRADMTMLNEEVAAHLNDARRGERLRNGFRVAVLGAPNAGKSSLINALAQRNAAIVSSVAGTTRDVIEVHLNLGGYPVILSDTAGLRETLDEIEAEGIARARAAAEAADLKLLLFDGGADRDAETLAWVDDRSLIVITKADLITSPAGRGCEAWPVSGLAQQGWRHDAVGNSDASLITNGNMPLASPAERGQCYVISTHTGYGMPKLLQAIEQRIATLCGDIARPASTRERHRSNLLTAQEALIRFASAQSIDLAAEDLRIALRAIGRITGRVDVEDLLDVIFRDFCIGK